MRGVSRPSRVLVVEDETLIALSLQAMLKDMGVQYIDCAANLDSAEQCIRVSPPDFAILDINIGSALVFPIAAELRKRGIPFAFSSGRGWGDLPEEFSHERFAPKPLDPEVLNSILSSVGFDAAQPVF